MREAYKNQLFSLRSLIEDKGHKKYRISLLRKNNNKHVVLKQVTILINSKTCNKDFKKLSLLTFTLKSATIIINQVGDQDDRIRTCDPLFPKQVRYQTALHPETLHTLSVQ